MRSIQYRSSELLPMPKSIRVIPDLFHCQSPTNVDIELSNRCNLRCRMCWFHGESGIGNRYAGCELTTTEVFNLVDRLSRHKPHIYIGGSEPFIRDDLMAILAHIRGRDLKVSFTTNGTLLDGEKIGKLVDLGVETVNFSFDGPEALHDRVRGAGVFAKAVSAIRELSAERKRRGRAAPVINVNITMTSRIVGHIGETVGALKEATLDGVDYYRMHHLWFITPSELARHRRVMGKALGCRAPGAAGHVIERSRMIDPVALADELSTFKEYARVKMFPNLHYAGIIKYYSDYPFTGRCFAPFRSALIKPNGDVRFCPDEWIDDYVLGNVRNDDFDAIWNNSRARKFRTVLWKRRCFPGCKRCSWLHPCQ